MNRQKKVFLMLRTLYIDQGWMGRKRRTRGMDIMIPAIRESLVEGLLALLMRDLMTKNFHLVASHILSSSRTLLLDSGICGVRGRTDFWVYNPLLLCRFGQ